MTKPTTRVYRALILEALKQGEGTAREIIERIGGEPPGGMAALSQWLRTLERRGFIQELRRDHTAPRRAPIIWALVQSQTEEAA